MDVVYLASSGVVPARVIDVHFDDTHEPCRYTILTANGMVTTDAHHLMLPPNKASIQASGGADAGSHVSSKHTSRSPRPRRPDGRDASRSSRASSRSPRPRRRDGRDAPQSSGGAPRGTTTDRSREKSRKKAGLCPRCGKVQTHERAGLTPMVSPACHPSTDNIYRVGIPLTMSFVLWMSHALSHLIDCGWTSLQRHVPQMQPLGRRQQSQK